MSLPKIFPGIVFASIFSALSVYLSGLIPKLPVNPFLLAIIFGFIIANLQKTPEVIQPGITFTMKKLLRLAIILLGFKISLNELMTVGGKGLMVITISFIACYLFNLWLAKKIGVKKELSTLLASGTSICGASAILATAGIIKAEEKDAAISVAIISIVGTIFMIAYPFLFYFLRLDPVIYSIWTGTSIHEVGQVIAAGFSVSEETGKLASLVKMSRVTFIVPLSFFLLINEFKQIKKDFGEIKIKELNIPWFVLGFILMIFVNSANFVPEESEKLIVQLDNFLLTAAMFCMGMSISLSGLKSSGMKPFYLCLGTSIFLSLISFCSTIIIFG